LKDTFAETVLPQIDELIRKYEVLLTSIDHRRLNTSEASGFLATSMAAIHRAVGSDSQYAKHAAEAIEEHRFFALSDAVRFVGGILKELRNDIASGYLVSVQELIHAEMFADFLEMARYLLSEGYRDPAAVLIGGVLEGHLRKLCAKNNIPIETTDSRGVPRPKKAETMNADLAREGVYSKLDQKSVTAWLDLRNKAAHGQYDEYTQQQVEFLLQQVTDFLTRYPA
jgi:hypothetical protein